MKVYGCPGCDALRDQPVVFEPGFFATAGEYLDHVDSGPPLCPRCRDYAEDEWWDLAIEDDGSEGFADEYLLAVRHFLRPPENDLDLDRPIEDLLEESFGLEPILCALCAHRSWHYLECYGMFALLARIERGLGWGLWWGRDRTEIEP